MIVADTNLFAYLLIEGEMTEAAENVLRADPDWAAPYLWRSELRNVLALYLRHAEIELSQALDLFERAEQLVTGREFFVPARTVLELVESSSRSAYDCEFIGLAQELGVKLVTADRGILQEFPTMTENLRAFAKAPSEDNEAT